MPRFVLLRHELPPASDTPSHWDLMLEHNGALLTWRLNTLPSEWGDVLPHSSGPLLKGRAREGLSAAYKPPTPKAPRAIPATQLPNHRLQYLDYEGPISINRGKVSRNDAGDYDLIEQTADRLAGVFHGQLVAGEFTLTRIGETNWQLTFNCQARRASGARAAD